jgi:ankyrin repeat protein
VDKYGQTALFYAAREGHLEICKKLICSMGADCDQVDTNGQTPLYYAIRSVRLEAVEFLIKEAGANVNH